MVNSDTFSHRGVFLALVTGVVAVLFGLFFVQQVKADSTASESGKRLLSVHDQGIDRGLLTRATTLREAFREARIAIDPNDRVEPGLDDKLVASNYEVNIYRARPVTIVDGETRVRVMSPYRTAKQIASEAGIALHDEDVAEMTTNTDVVGQGMGVQLTITRATEFTLGLYGKKTTAYTQAKTVADMLKEKGITLASDDTVSAKLDAPIIPGMTIAIWRDGAQTVTEEQAIPFAVQKVLDMDHPIGFHQVKTKGVPGKRLVTYVVVMKDGKEIGRKQIQNVVGSQPKTQVELVGNKPVNPLS
ncbi:MAG TPA: ubiquitin-like domain-containing protein, partial [Candidatus Saccharimonadales bacterium]|nr:ubiquitin-like domain-containing protein [Candidatus Saccharimonadales bacterium]